jgi:hypothetical protein
LLNTERRIKHPSYHIVGVKNKLFLLTKYSAYTLIINSSEQASEVNTIPFILQRNWDMN